MNKPLESEFDDETGVVKYSGARIVLSQEASYSNIQKSLESIDSQLARRVMYENGEVSMHESVSSSERAFIATARALVRKKMIERLLLFSLQRGFGLMRFGAFDYARGRGKIVVGNSIIARTYGKSRGPACFLISGLLAGTAQIVYGGCFVCREERCKAAGAAFCEFSLSTCTPDEHDAFLGKTAQTVAQQAPKPSARMAGGSSE